MGVRPGSNLLLRRGPRGTETRDTGWRRVGVHPSPLMRAVFFALGMRVDARAVRACTRTFGVGSAIAEACERAYEARGE